MTRERRFMVPGIPSEGEVEIAGNEAHHLLHVLRLKLGDEMASMSRMVQKLTELGARRIIPIVTARTTATASGAARQLPRWRRIAAEACKQSGRSMVPMIEDPISFDELLETDLPAARFLLTVGGPSFREQEQHTSLVAAVGPEGGWTAEEIAAAVAKGFAPVGLGPRTLRTETAALAAASVLQWLWGDSPP